MSDRYATLVVMSRGVKLIYTDDDLRRAVATSVSWREVLRTLGYRTTNGELAKAVRHQAEALGVDTAQVGRRGGRSVSWTDRDLRQAAASSNSWDDAVCSLGVIPSVTAIGRARKRARELQLDTCHLQPPGGTLAEPPRPSLPSTARPSGPARTTNEKGTRAEGAVLAALLRAGYNVLVPFGVVRYDLLIEDADGRFHRVQCKTGRLSHRSTSVEFNVVSSRPGSKRKDYVNDVEYFGVYLPDLDEVYLILIADVAHLSYQARLRLKPSEFGRPCSTPDAGRYRLVAQQDRTHVSMPCLAVLSDGVALGRITAG
jgi:hypothetical protein